MTAPRFLLCCLIIFLTAIFTGCETVTPVATVPDAENLLMTTGGRFFASGGLNLYEVTGTFQGEYSCHRLVAEDTYFLGLAEYCGHLYALTNSSGVRYLTRPEPGLVIAPLDQIDPDAGPLPLNQGFVIHPLSDLGSPNGMAVDEHGRVYIADTTRDTIVRFDIDAQDPTRIHGPFESGLSGLSFPNGMAVEKDMLYFTDGGSVKQAVIADNGDLRDEKTLHATRSLLDDLAVYGDYLIVCNYLKGTLLVLSKQGGVVYETAPETLAFPSAVAEARGPMFGPDDLLVTEKGLILETRSSFGNRVGLMAVPWGD